jgi:hypothetical protein
MCRTRQAMTRLVAILVTLFLVAIPAKADVALWPRPVLGWTVIQVYGVIKLGDLATFQSYTANVDPQTTLVIVTGPGGNLSAGIGMGLRVHQKKLIVGAMGMCASSCALMWIGGETGRKFVYKDRPGVLTLLCFHQASNPVIDPPGHVLPGPFSGNIAIREYLAYLGYNQEMIGWATAADPQHRLCLNPELAKQFNINFWYNTEDGGGQHYRLPGNHGLLDGVTLADERARQRGTQTSIVTGAAPRSFRNSEAGYGAGELFRKDSAAQWGFGLPDPSHAATMTAPRLDAPRGPMSDEPVQSNQTNQHFPPRNYKAEMTGKGRAGPWEPPVAGPNQK